VRGGSHGRLTSFWARFGANGSAHPRPEREVGRAYGAVMVFVRGVAVDVADIAWGNRWWMTWNSFLAVLPALLAVPLFRHRRRLGPVRIAGVVTFVLLLPNAPYVVTDLIHLRGDVAQADTDLAVVAGVLPLYGAFIVLGFASYALGLHEVAGWLRRTDRARWVRAVELVLHALCAVGVLLGRVTRLNTWDVFTEPDGAVERALQTLSWRGSPFVVVGLFVVIWLGHAVTRTLAASLADVALRQRRQATRFSNTW
jgi:uncharacterized membrane protein